MKDGYVVVKFTDNGVVKIAPFALIKNLDGSKFAPKSCMDLPELNVKVKWQMSLTSGDFSHDGYYEAEALAIANSLTTATEKAKALHLKLPPCSVLTLPAKQNLPVTKAGSTRGSSKRNVQTVKLSGEAGNEIIPPKKAKSECKETVKVSGEAGNEIIPPKKAKSERKETVKVSGEAGNEIIPPKKAKSERKETVKTSSVSGDHDSETKKKKRTNFKAKDKVTFKRLYHIGESVYSNPLMAEAAKDKTELRSAMESQVAANVNESEDDSSDDERTSDKIGDKEEDNNTKGDSSLDHKLNKEEKNNIMRSESVKSCNKQSTKEESSSDDSVSLADDEKIRKECDEDLDSTLPTSQQDLPTDCEESDQSSSDHEASSVSEDATATLMDKNEKLEKTVAALKTKLEEVERQLIVCNNVRLKQKDDLKKCEDDKRKLEKDLELARQKLKRCEKRNETLQDLLAANASSSTCKKSNKEASPTAYASSSTSKKSTKEASPRTKSISNYWHSNNDDDEMLPDDSLNDEKEGDISDIELQRNLESNFSAERKADSGGKTSDKKPRKKPEASDSESSDKQDCFKIKKRKKGSSAGVDLDDPYLEETCQKVLSHLKGSPLPVDDKGKMTVGQMRVSKKLFDDNFKSNRLDVVKATRNLTAMAWSETERIQRSLTGKANNRHGGEAKRQATPKKVLSILGSVKAHMLNCGDKDGPGMRASLKQCEKVIGSKLSTDAQAVKRQQKS